MDDYIDYFFYGIAILLSILIPCLATCDSDGSNKRTATESHSKTQGVVYQTQPIQSLPVSSSGQSSCAKEFFKEENQRQEYQAPARSSSRSVSPDDAYDEGYSEGYEQGREDGSHGRSHGWDMTIPATIMIITKPCIKRVTLLVTMMVITLVILNMKPTRKTMITS